MTAKQYKLSNMVRTTTCRRACSSLIKWTTRSEVEYRCFNGMPGPRTCPKVGVRKCLQSTENCDSLLVGQVR